jgi:hypothetical protein
MLVKTKNALLDSFSLRRYSEVGLYLLLLISIAFNFLQFIDIRAIDIALPPTSSDARMLSLAVVAVVGILVAYWFYLQKRRIELDFKTHLIQEEGRHLERELQSSRWHDRNSLKTDAV